MHRAVLLGVPAGSAGTVREEQDECPASWGAFKTTDLSLLLNDAKTLKMRSLPDLLPRQ